MSGTRNKTRFVKIVREQIDKLLTAATNDLKILKSKIEMTEKHLLELKSLAREESDL